MKGREVVCLVTLGEHLQSCACVLVEQLDYSPCSQ